MYPITVFMANMTPVEICLTEFSIPGRIQFNFPDCSAHVNNRCIIMFFPDFRFDFPKHWPELVPSLMSAIKSNDLLTQNRGLMMLHQTVKRFSTIRLVADRRMFQEMSLCLIDDIQQIWEALCQVFTSKVRKRFS